MAEQHNVLLIKYHEARPTGAAQLPETNRVQAHDQPERQQDRGHNNMRECGTSRGRYNNRRGGGNQRRENHMAL